LIADAAPRRDVPDAIKRNAAIAPRFEPATPMKLDEFAQDPNLKSVHFGFDRATLRPSEVRIVKSDARWLKANAPYEVVVEAYAEEIQRHLARQEACRARRSVIGSGLRTGGAERRL
jgi:outer membrane protein OmpA-like peptidoglycan-associated protein